LPVYQYEFVTKFAEILRPSPGAHARQNACSRQPDQPSPWCW
jgi:hypothetical protein